MTIKYIDHKLLSEEMCCKAFLRGLKKLELYHLALFHMDLASAFVLTLDFQNFLKNYIYIPCLHHLLINLFDLANEVPYNLCFHCHLLMTLKPKKRFQHFSI